MRTSTSREPYISAPPEAKATAPSTDSLTAHSTEDTDSALLSHSHLRPENGRLKFLRMLSTTSLEASPKELKRRRSLLEESTIDLPAIRKANYQATTELDSKSTSVRYFVSDGPNRNLACDMQTSLTRDDAFIDALLVNLLEKAQSSATVDAIGILGLVKSNHHQEPGFHFITCRQGLRPVGIMVVEKLDAKETYIHHVVSDDAYPGTAKAMMQQAATMAVADRSDGKLTVSPLNETVSNIFQNKYGFANIDADTDTDEYGEDDDLVLKPNASSRWKAEAGIGMVLK